MLTLGASISIELMVPGSLWQIETQANGYQNLNSHELATQVVKGRSFQLLTMKASEDHQGIQFSRIQVRLLEDGYICWLELSDVLGLRFCRDPGISRN